MKRALIALLFLVGAVSCSQFWENLQSVPDGYQKKFNYPGIIEKMYSADGQYAVDVYEQESEEEIIKLFQVYYPVELNTSDKRWPVVIMANGTGTPARKYKAIFKHLASWGFIVIGNQDEWAWNGNSANLSQAFISAENENPQSIFYQKVDMENIGLTGHSQGGMSVYTAASLYENSGNYKALCTQSGTAVMLADSLGWDFLKPISAPMLMMGGGGDSDAKFLCPLEAMVRTYDHLDAKPVIMGRIKGVEHGDMLPRGDAYMTAWMRYWLCGDEKAGGFFLGDDAEILTNSDWQDVQRKGL
jgi:hypothetical protein